MTENTRSGIPERAAGTGASGSGTAAPDSRLRLNQGLAILFTGLGVGWLVGLSVSPVVSAVIAVLLALAGPMASTFREVLPSDSIQPKTNAWPVALLTLGVALGATTGIFVRTHDILGPENREDIQEIAQNDGHESRAGDLASKTGLFSQPGGDECKDLLSAGSRRIRFVFRSSGLEEVRALGELIENPEILQKVAEALCAN
ncbi:MAG: hypothetical protein GY835_03090 [bacterium]|nr:hypothetical protein [bacterium]